MNQSCPDAMADTRVVQSSSNESRTESMLLAQVVSTQSREGAETRKHNLVRKFILCASSRLGAFASKSSNNQSLSQVESSLAYHTMVHRASHHQRPAGSSGAFDVAATPESRGDEQRRESSFTTAIRSAWTPPATCTTTSLPLKTR